MQGIFGNENRSQPNSDSQKLDWISKYWLGMHMCLFMYHEERRALVLKFLIGHEVFHSFTVRYKRLIAESER